MNNVVSPYVYPGIGDLKVQMQIEKGEVLKPKYNKHIILDACIKVFNTELHESFTKEFVKSKTRKREIVEIRQCAMYIMQKETKLPLKAIGGFFNGRDHSTVIHACRTWSDLMDTSRRFVEITESVYSEIRKLNYRNGIKA